MIRYRLACSCGHEFESWFANSRSYEKLEKRRGLQCPACGGASITKAIMAPRIASGRGRKSGAPEAARPEDTPAQETRPQDTQMATDNVPASVADAHREFLAAARRLREEVKARSDYVGPKFAEEARRIDAGESPDRGIYGEATRDEARSLIEDGIAILPLPRLPEDQN